jgi:hypothetical protein
MRNTREKKSVMCFSIKLLRFVMSHIDKRILL